LLSRMACSISALTAPAGSGDVVIEGGRLVLDTTSGHFEASPNMPEPRIALASIGTGRIVFGLSGQQLDIVAGNQQPLLHVANPVPDNTFGTTNVISKFDSSDAINVLVSSATATPNSVAFDTATNKLSVTTGEGLTGALYFDPTQSYLDDVFVAQAANF